MGALMLLKGNVTIHAPRKTVWDFLTDPKQIGECAPGVEKLEVVDEMKKYEGVVSVGLGSVKARFSGTVEILELDEPNRAKLKAHGTATELGDPIEVAALTQAFRQKTVLTELRV